MSDQTPSPRKLRKLIREYQQSLASDPENLVLRLKLALALRQNGQLREAVDLCRTVATTYVERGRLVQAAAVCRGILAIDPDQAETKALLRRIEEPLAAQEKLGGSRGSEELTGAGRGTWGDELLSTLPPVPYDAATRSDRGARSEPSSPPQDPAATAKGYVLQMVAEAAEPSFPEAPSEPSLLTSAPGRARAALTPLPSALAIPEGDGDDPAVDDADDADLPTNPSQLRAVLSDPSSDLRDGSLIRSPEALGAAPVLEDDPALDPALDPMAGLVATTVPVPLLCALPRQALTELVHRMEVKRCAPGDTIVREGDQGDALFVVSSGHVRILKRRVEGGIVEIARLGPGDLFGEFAVLGDRHRHATVVAEDEADLLVLTRRVLGLLLNRHPEAGSVLRRFYRERLFATLLATAPFFSGLSDEERDTLSTRFRFRRFTAGSPIVTQGEPGGGLYLILVGGVDIVYTDPVHPDHPPRRVAQLGEGSYFGEMSLLRGGVACASVVAERMCECVQLPPKDFYSVVGDHPALWKDLKTEAARRELENTQILAGVAFVT
jgi:CRP-like cAMP-binding protein